MLEITQSTEDGDIAAKTPTHTTQPRTIHHSTKKPVKIKYRYVSHSDTYTLSTNCYTK